VGGGGGGRGRFTNESSTFFALRKNDQRYSPTFRNCRGEDRSVQFVYELYWRGTQNKTLLTQFMMHPTYGR